MCVDRVQWKAEFFFFFFTKVGWQLWDKLLKCETKELYYLQVYWNNALNCYQVNILYLPFHSKQLENLTKYMEKFF